MLSSTEDRRRVSFDRSLSSTDRMKTHRSKRPNAPNAEELRKKMITVWNDAKSAYRDAGQPFGTSTRAIEVWMTYGRITNGN